MLAISRLMTFRRFIFDFSFLDFDALTAGLAK